MTSWAYGPTVAHVMEHKPKAGSWPGGWVSRCQYNLRITWEQYRGDADRFPLFYLSPWGGEEPDKPWCRRCLDLTWRDAYALLFAEGLYERLTGQIGECLSEWDRDTREALTVGLSASLADAMATGTLWKAS